MNSLFNFLNLMLYVNNKNIHENIMSSSPQEWSSLFRIECIGPGKGRLSIDLSEYITAILNNEDTHTIFEKYVHEIGQGSGAILMNQFFENTLQNIPELSRAIKKSDIIKIINENGHEIIKNTLDECLFSCLKNPYHSPIASLEMTITYDADTVQVFFHDNGQGFPEEFLSHFINDINIYQYLTESGSYRKKSHIDDLLEFKQKFGSNSEDYSDDLTTIEDNFSQRSLSPVNEPLSDTGSPRGVILSQVNGFGGRGLGLRNLIANTLTGYNIQDITAYNKNISEPSLTSLKQKNSSIELFNPISGGACISIKLPLEPRQIKDMQKLINSKLKLSNASFFQSFESDSNHEEEFNKSMLDKIAFKRSKTSK